MNFKKALQILNEFPRNLTNDYEKAYTLLHSPVLSSRDIAELTDLSYTTISKYRNQDKDWLKKQPHQILYLVHGYDELVKLLNNNDSH